MKKEINELTYLNNILNYKKESNADMSRISQEDLDNINKGEAYINEVISKDYSQTTEKDFMVHCEDVNGTLAEILDIMKNLKYTIYLNQEKVNFINTFLKRKLKITAKTLFFGLHIMKTVDMFPKLGDEDEALTVDSGFLILLTHLLEEDVNITGMTLEAYIFGNVLIELSEANKVYQELETKIISINEKVQNFIVKTKVLDDQPETETDSQTTMSVTK